MNKLKQLNHFHVIYLLILILGLLLRFISLDARVLHHDESLHGMYSLYYFQDSSTMFYKYNPLLHGPFLYHILPWFMWVFGISKWAIRLPSFLLGSLLMLVPLIFKNYISKKNILLGALIIAISPSLTYWSRFIRHDNFIFALIALILFSIFCLKGWKKPLVLMGAIAASFATKENSYIHLVFFLTYLCYEAFILKVSKAHMPSLFSIMFQYIRNNLYILLGSLFIGALIYCHYYSAGFVYPKGIIDGLYRKSLVYWFDQHHQERITGPFSFQFLINSSFELWWFVLLITHLVKFYWKKITLDHIFFFSSILVALICHFSFSIHHYPDFVNSILKIKIPLDFYIFFPLITHSVIVTTYYLRQDDRARALSGFLFFASFFTYSYLGEKVPWLALYPLLSGLVFFMFDFNHFKNRKLMIGILSLLVIHAFTTNLWSNFSHQSEPKNLLSQVHTTDKFDDLMKSLRYKLLEKPSKLFLVEKAPTWPTTWYMRNLKGYHFNKLKTRYDQYDYIMSNPSDHKLERVLTQKFKKEIIPLRSWWLPDYSKMGTIEFMNYVLFKKNWNDAGAQNIVFWTKTPLQKEGDDPLLETP